MADDAALQAVRQFAQTCLDDLTHTRQVAGSALQLFDALVPLHRCGEQERDWLCYGAWLHDIGWAQGWKEHHKKSLKMILDNQILPFSSKEKLIIGSIARYHRKALPDIKHDHFAALQPAERRVVSKMAALLRIADALDYQHNSNLQSVTAAITPQDVILNCFVSSYATQEESQAYKKADLFEKIYKRRLYLRFQEQQNNSAAR